MLDGAAADRHCVRHGLEPALHLIEHRLMLPSSEALFLTGCAERGHWAGTAGLLVLLDVDELASLNGGMALPNLLTDRAAI